MTSRPKQPEPRPVPRLMLVTPRVDDAGAFARPLAEALAAGDVAAVVLRLSGGDERTQINRAKALAGIVQGAGAALLLDGHADLAARAGADGAHLIGIDAFNDALEILKPDRIAGAGGLASRHDAMVAAEAGADYVMFGEPDEHGTRPDFTAIEERLNWWADVFESPCVGYAASADEIPALVAAGADFVALGDWIWSDPGATVSASMRHMRLPEAAT